MTVTVVIPTGIAAELESATMGLVETAGVLLASIVETSRGVRLLARQMVWVEDSQYVEREASGMSIRSGGYVHALACADKIGATAIWLHTHPGLDSSPVASMRDKTVDAQIADLFRLRTGSPYYGALILSPVPGGLSFTGHLESEDGSSIPIDHLWLVGDRLRLVSSFHSPRPGLSPVFDRNVRAFGTAVQETLGKLHVGIAGCGGTGSAVAEQLVRLGVRQITLVDPDDLSSSNVTRVYGSTLADVGRPKVDILGAHLSRIDPDVNVETFRGAITQEQIARSLVACDVLFGCTDDNGGRLVLSRAATYLLIPVFDCGVLITSTAEGKITGVDGRITVLVPGQGCLVCRGRINLAEAAAELLTPEERTRRADEGYAPALGAIEPAIVTFTTAVAAFAVAELLERLIGYGPVPRPSEVLLRYHEREISTNAVRPRDGHYCHPASGKAGIGITEPFLDQTWSG
jgi:molybdopterin/thiamine biosynthesis adenylyltransferase